ncbi:MAG: amylo-alpha-1,6-glucosidase [Acidobacteriia bacterium]|nr:amylo-alpha-1,6-glucosidase [Terriglobia bacterium]
MRHEPPSAPTSKPPGLVSPVNFGREIAGDLAAAEQREWLITNGIGGYASGTVAGLLTRRYHGLLIAALKPPLGRTLLVAKLEETAEYDGRSYSLSTNRWASGAVDPQGFRYIERFRLEGTTPVWTYACADALVEKRIWMRQGANTTCIRYSLARGSLPLRLTLKALVNYRDHHLTTVGADWRMEITPVGRGLRVLPFSGATPFYLLSAKAGASPEHTWYRDFELAAERARGLEDKEDHLHAGTFRATLGPGESVTIVLSTDSASKLDGERAWEERAAYDRELVAAWVDANPAIAEDAPAWIPQLVLAADQFIVDRKSPNHPNGKTVIAGYHWFEDWGRDTMIALGGLTLATGRPKIARNILRTFARFVDRGMLPNRFQEKGDAPEYNTVDATLWFFEAIRRYLGATRDLDFLREVYPALVDIVDGHERGTRYNIHVDQADGLLCAGEPGVQLTWMDAKVGDWVVTPRIGKPIEVNALWLNALATMRDFSRVLRRPSAKFESLAAKAQVGFRRFWNPDLGYCYDVLDGPEGNDATLRPNQIFAVALPASALSPEQQKAVVDTCSRVLLTSHGLRSLSPADPHYQGHYGGPPRARDAAYHQGTVWGWLLGPFVRAHLRVYKDAASALSFLAPMEHHLKLHGLGTAAEIFDGDAPFAPRGCIAQAWTVAEVLSAWQEVAAWAKAHQGSAAL